MPLSQALAGPSAWPSKTTPRPPRTWTATSLASSGRALECTTSAARARAAAAGAAPHGAGGGEGGGEGGGAGAGGGEAVGAGQEVCRSRGRVSRRDSHTGGAAGGEGGAGAASALLGLAVAMVAVAMWVRVRGRWCWCWCSTGPGCSNGGCSNIHHCYTVGRLPAVTALGGLGGVCKHVGAKLQTTDASDPPRRPAALSPQ